MRIVSLHPLATDVLDYCGVGWDLVGITHVCAKPTNAAKASILTVGHHRPFKYFNQHHKRLAAGLSHYPLNIEHLKDCIPDIILADINEPNPTEFIQWAEGFLKKAIGRPVVIRHLATDTLADVYTTMEDVGDIIGKRILASKLVEDIKLHVTSWAQDYSILCKGKKVLLLSETDPFIFEAGWVDDLIHLFGGITCEKHQSAHSVPITWNEILKERPDVIFVAPHNTFLNQSVKRLSSLENSEGWEELPAVKRGQVFFAPGMDLYRPGPRFLKGLAAFVSAMAGVEKPIMKDQDDYYRIRQVEMYRHKLLDR
jgi:ABC-type Fe3+-hydroxamate transport system substrate-binding protein